MIICLQDQVQLFSFHRWSPQQNTVLLLFPKGRKKSQLLPLALYAPALCNNLEQCSETTRSQQLLWHQLSVFTVESSTVQLFLIQHQMNALRIDVGYHQHSNYLINRRSKNKDCRVMDPPTTGIKRGWLCWESHLCTKERSAAYRQ